MRNGQKKLPIAAEDLSNMCSAAVLNILLHLITLSAALVGKGPAFPSAKVDCFRTKARALGLALEPPKASHKGDHVTKDVHRTPNTYAMSRSRTRDFSRVVFSVSRVSACQLLLDAQHVHVAQGPHGSSVGSSQKHFLRALRSMAYSTPSLMIPPSLGTCSLLTCTPTRPSIRPSTGPLQISSDENYHCDDPRNVSFGPLADLHAPTGYEPKDLAEEDNPVHVKPFFFHRQSMTSTHGSAEILLNRIWTMSKYGPCWLHHSFYRGEKQVLTDHEFITPQEKTQCQVHLTFEKKYGKPVARESTEKPIALFSNKRKSRNTFQQRIFFLRTSTQIL